MSSLEWKKTDSLVEYNDAIEFMEKKVDQIIHEKSPETIWLLEHPSLYTAGTSANINDLLEKDKFPVYQTGRGGQYTYHGPGQRIAYVMLNLKDRNAQDIKAYVYNIEQWIINTLNRFQIDSQRKEGRVGIWVDLPDGSEAKIAAIGIRVRKWVTYHGVAVNINPDLKNFSGIVPCGISQHGVTSFFQIGKNVTMNEFDKVFQEEFLKIFSNPSL